MTEYIERMIQNAQAAYRSMDDPLMDEAKFIADFLTAADVAPVRHGRWIDSEDDYGSYVTCSICKDEFTCWEADCAYTKFCPNCGAMMDGGDDNG